MTVDPPLHTWQPTDPSARHADDRAALAQQVNAHARRLGTGELPAQLCRIIATGHQAWLWHPGILAKDVAMVQACRRFAASPLHLVVDQDTHEALTLELPRQVGKRIEVRYVRLGSHRADLPTGAQPPVDAAAACQTLRRLDDPRVEAIVEAFTDLPACRTLAEQLAVVTVRLMAPWLDTDGPVHVPLLFVSDLPALPGYAAIIDRMMGDASRCVRAYNAAVRAVPEAGVTELVELRELVELPLWAVRWRQPRQRVFVDLGDSTSLLVDEAGEPIDREAVQLLPRALLLSAVMRSIGSDLFIHGKGGGLYDRATEQWWQGWCGEPLAPGTVVSADLRLPFDQVPVADDDELARAVWFRHHLPHNVDRLLNVNGPAAQQKRDLLAHMDDDRDRKRRRRAFEQLRAINDQLLAAHPDLLAKADRRLDDARQGLTNAHLARRRDWCFALYPGEQLAALSKTSKAARVGE